jgi:hypothetical protein
VEEEAKAVAAELALQALAVFLVAATVSSLALLAVLRRLGRHVQTIEQALQQGEGARISARALKEPFGPALRTFFETTRRAEAQIADLHAGLERGNRA